MEALMRKILAHTEVRATSQVQLTDVPEDEALHFLARTNGFEIGRIGASLALGTPRRLREAGWQPEDLSKQENWVNVDTIDTDLNATADHTAAGSPVPVGQSPLPVYIQAVAMGTFGEEALIHWKGATHVVRKNESVDDDLMLTAIELTRVWIKSRRLAMQFRIPVGGGL
jgi:hypothetical protein